MHSRQVSFALSITKLKEKIRFRDHPNSAIDIVANTSSPVTTKIDGKFISGRGYSPCFNHFLLNVQCYNERKPVAHSARGWKLCSYGS